MKKESLVMSAFVFKAFEGATIYFPMVLAFSFWVVGCIEPYNPPEIEQAENYLVVDGFLDIGSGEATVKLSRTQNLNDEAPPPVESGAQLSIETEDGESFAFVEISPGEYHALNVTVAVLQKCRLLIRTSGAKEYASDFVEPKETPLIDSITWSAEPEALNIRVTTHDATGQTEFYRWSMVETAQYYAAYFSAYIFDPVLYQVRFRTAEEQAIWVCWKEAPLSAIKVATSRGLEYDLIDKFTLVSLDPTSWKHKVKYSLLVNQYAIGEDEYNYWTRLKKNTESVGTIFDPQPSEAKGNVRSLTNASEPVLGYFSAGTAVSQRIFIDASELPYTFNITGYESCSNDSLLYEDFWFSPDAYTIVNEYTNELGAVFAYGVSSPFCIDCRQAHDGTTTRPEYWP